MTANELLQAEAIRHALALRGYSDNLVTRMIAALNRSDPRLLGELLDALDRLDPDSFTVERLESLLVSVRSLNAAAYQDVNRELTQALRDYALYEATYQNDALVMAVPLPLRVHVAAINAEAVYAAAVARPFQGALLREILVDTEANRARLIRQTVTQGFLEGRTTDQIVRDLRGTRARGYADGLMNRSRRDIEAITRTALGHMAGFVQDRHVEANAGIIKAVKWSSTLDLRTSETCRVRDGMLYHPVTHKPMGHQLPWLGGPSRAHWNCRSAQVPITKSFSELTGIPGLPEWTPTQRASMDGQVPNELTYADWLGKQSAARQDDVLGPARGRLMRDGGLSLKDMYSARGKPLSLDEMRERDAEAFAKSGM